MNKKIRYPVLTVLFGLMGVLFAVLMLLTIFVPNRASNVTVKEPITVSASLLDQESQMYIAQIRGSLLNEGDIPLTVDALKITVSDGQTEQEISLEGFVLESRLAQDILYDVRTQTVFDRVQSVTIVCNGEASSLLNRAETNPFDFDTLIWLALTLLAIHFAIYFGKQTYYIGQEEKMLSQRD